MQPLSWERRPDGLRAPALVCAFKGWNDAGRRRLGGAVASSARRSAPTRFATIDPEEFFDFQATRPTVQLVDGQTRAIDWPEVEIYAARDPARAARPGPALRPRALAALAHVLRDGRRPRRGARRADGRDARRAARRRPAHAPGGDHRRSPPTTALVERLGLEPPELRGPDRDRRRPPRRLRGGRHARPPRCGPRVPHYVAVAPNPKAALALVRKLEALVGVTVDATRARGRRRRLRAPGLAAPSRCDPDVQAFVERLERAADEEDERASPTTLPSGDVLAREFQRFLRQRGSAAGRRPDRQLALGRRAGDPVVAHRAGRAATASARSPGRGSRRRPRATVSRDPVAVVLGARRPAPSRRRARSSRPAARPRAATPRARRPRRARAGRPRAAAPAVFGRPVL